MKLGPRLKIALAIVGVLTLLAGWQGFRFWWYHGYSTGERTGVLRKLSVKGSPICKYADGGLALTRAQPGHAADGWTFFGDDHSTANPIMKDLREAESARTHIT